MSEELIALFADIFDVEPDKLTPETTLEELCADEYDLEEISFNLEELFDFEPDVKKLKKLKTLHDVQEYVKENAK